MAMKKPSNPSITPYRPKTDEPALPDDPAPTRQTKRPSTWPSPWFSAPRRLRTGMITGIFAGIAGTALLTTIRRRRRDRSDAD